MAHVFISYAHSDGVYARKLADHLLANGFDVWIDDRIDFGSRWIRSIFTAIDDCAAFIVIMTPRAFEREWVENERLYARKRGKIVFPLLLEGEAFPDLGATQYYDVSGGKLPERAFLERLAKFAPRRATGGQDVAAAPQQQAKLERETSEMAQAEVQPHPATTIPPAPDSEAEPEARREPELQFETVPASSSPAPRRTSRSTGLLVFVGALVLVGIAAGGIVTLVTQLTANAVPTPTPAPTPLGGGYGQIAFVSTRDGDEEIYTMNLDETELRNLTNNSARDDAPTWSPDGSQIAFMSYREDACCSVVYVMDANGDNQHRLTNATQYSYNPAWSPDGTQIAMTVYTDGNAEIYIVDTDGSNLRRITNTPEDDTNPTWSPDGTKIAFQSDQNGNAEIYVMNVDGTGLRNLTSDSAQDRFPTWSPSADLIAFQSDRDNINYPAIYVMDSDGGNVRLLNINSEDGYDAAWSPDGKQIAFSSYLSGNGQEIYMMNTDGTNVRRLTDSGGSNANPAWRP